MKKTTGSQITTYTYDSFNRPVEVVNSDGSYQLNQYDAMGLRVGVTENGVSYQFIFSGRNIIAEMNSNTGGLTRYVRGNALIATEDHGGITSYYLHNAHGDVTNLVNSNGEILNSYQYDAFGNTTNYAAKVNNRFLYAGEQFDKVTGQYYLRARYYDPEIGRFTQEDRYRGDGLNLYAYVSNNPVRYVDPSGYYKDSTKKTSNNLPPELLPGETKGTDNTEQQKTPLAVIEKDKKYYVRSNKGNVTINGLKYFETNSHETITLYTVYNIDYDFQSKGYVYGVNNALPKDNLSYPKKLQYVYRESKTNGELDQKKNLNNDTLYLFNDKLYNKNEAGNIIWGGAMKQMGFMKSTTISIAQGGTVILEKRLDESHDQRAIKEGWDYQKKLIEEQNKNK